MKINKSILCIPPYISTPWENVSLLQYMEDILRVTLIDGLVIEVPHLSAETATLAFEMHAEALESMDEGLSILEHEKLQANATASSNPFEQFASMLQQGGDSLGFPITLGPEGFGGAMAHNPEQSDIPDLPKEALHKIGIVAKALGEELPIDMPKPEPHCNCVHCQIARTFNDGGAEESVDSELDKILSEEVSDDDLRFREWDIKETDHSQQIFVVSNPMDQTEAYNVCLKPSSIGCTCGQPDCAHIKAVLNS